MKKMSKLIVAAAVSAALVLQWLKIRLKLVLLVL